MCEKPTIYTDCQGVFDTWGHILQALHSNKTPIVDDHMDLWGPIIDCVATSYQHVKIVKVKAHTDNHDWLSLANAYADCEAKKSITEDYRNLLEFANTRVNSLLNLRNIQRQVMYFQTQAAIMEFNCNSQVPPGGNLTAPVMALPVEPLRQMIFDIGDVNCIYGNLFLSRLASWASNIYWESKSNHSTSF